MHGLICRIASWSEFST